MKKLSNNSYIFILLQLTQFKLTNGEKLTDTKTSLIALADNFVINCSNSESKLSPGQFLSLELPQGKQELANGCKLSLIAPNGQLIAYECPNYQSLGTWKGEAAGLGWVCDNEPNKIE
jgi:hypothetical protein